MEHTLVEINDGKLRGCKRRNYKGEDFHVFLGIPYAKPPVGKLRFRAPEPVEPWNGIRDAVEDIKACFQTTFNVSGSLNASEDCLVLNVFTKNISSEGVLKPVIFFIHGGAFTMGSSQLQTVNPDFLIGEDIVLVSINYRLGILGFLKLEDTSLGVPGNAGMKDMVLALKWVQKNISKFGGDPNNVTISGISAGSVAVNLLILSPITKGLFHKAIMLSGSVLNPWPHLNTESIHIIKYLGKKCTSESEILEVLEKTPPEELIDAQSKMARELKDSPIRSFAPCVEKPNETAFLTRNPIDIIRSGEYNKVPMIITYASNEGLIAFLEPQQLVEADKKGNFDNLIPQQMNLTYECSLKTDIRQKLKDFYKSEKYENLPLLACGDALFVAGIVGLAKNFISTCPEPIFFSKFDVTGSRETIRKIFSVGPEHFGAAHGDEIGYLFNNSLGEATPIVPGSIEDKIRNRLLKFWVNFAKYGHPTPDFKEFNLIWKPVTEDTFYYLHFCEELSIKRNPDDDRMELWREIYKLHENTEHFMP